MDVSQPSEPLSKMKDLEILEQQQKIIGLIRNYIIHTAKTMNLTARFAQGKRKSDLLLIKLRGKRKNIQTINTYLKNGFPEVDTEVPEILQKYDCFTLIVTQKLTNQETITNEGSVEDTCKMLSLGTSGVATKRVKMSEPIIIKKR